jgi:hypothetical protein
LLSLRATKSPSRARFALLVGHRACRIHAGTRRTDGERNRHAGKRILPGIRDAHDDGLDECFTCRTRKWNSRDVGDRCRRELLGRSRLAAPGQNGHCEDESNGTLQ